MVRCEDGEVSSIKGKEGRVRVEEGKHTSRRGCQSHSVKIDRACSLLIRSTN